MGNFSREKLQKRILDEMKKRGDNQKTLAEKIGMTAADMSKLLNGGRNISIDHLVSIADAYGLSIDDMLDRADTMTARDICRAIVRIDRNMPLSINPVYKNPKHQQQYAIEIDLMIRRDDKNNPNYDRFAVNKFLGDYAKLREVFREDREQLARLTDSLIDGLS